MPDSDNSKYEEAIARAIDFERRQDPFNALEWSCVALRFLPSDPVALRHKSRAEQEILRLKNNPSAVLPISLSITEREALEKHMLLAESFLANGVKTLAVKELQKAIKIFPNHPHLQRLCEEVGITLPEPRPDPVKSIQDPVQSDSSDVHDTNYSADSAYDTSPATCMDNDKSLFIRRLAVAKALIKASKPDSARRVLLDLQARFGPSDEITELFLGIS